MARKRLPPNDPREWLNRARSNLAAARKVDLDVYLEDLCFDAQQAAEKAIKGVFIKHAVSFPYIHNLAQLLTSLARTGVKVPKYVWEVVALSRYAVGARYPGHGRPVIPREHRRAVRLAEAVIRWATRQIK